VGAACGVRLGAWAHARVRYRVPDYTVLGESDKMLVAEKYRQRLQGVIPPPLSLAPCGQEVQTVTPAPASRPGTAFDLIELNGDDLRRDPLEVRKATLRSMLAISASLPST